MIEKLVRRMMAAQILSTMTVSLCLLIDNVMIGRFLGVSGLAADSLASPVLMVLNAVCVLVSSGVQVVCSRALGKGLRDEVDRAYSTVLVFTLIFSISFMALVCGLRLPLAKLMGAQETELLNNTAGYIAGFAVGAPAIMGTLVLTPFLQNAGKSNLLIKATSVMTITDIVFDLLNVYVFHGGMFGMGLASSFSYYAALVFYMGYFLSSKCIYVFSKANVKLKIIKEFLVGGFPTVVDLAAALVMVFVMNQILLNIGGDLLVAAFSVILNVGNVIKSVSMGTAGVSLSLSGIFFYDEDRSALRDMLRAIIRTASVMSILVTALLLVIAPFVVRLIIPDADEEYMKEVAVGLRLFSFGLLPCSINSALKDAYQGTGRIKTMGIIALFENLALPVTVALIINRLFGADGIWLYFLVAEVVMLLGIGVLSITKRQADMDKWETLLILPENFGVPSENILEFDIHSLEDAVLASRKAEEFCNAHGTEERKSKHIALCIEEMGTNVVRHGFSENGNDQLSIRLQYKDGNWTLRFRDNCPAFDPVAYVSENKNNDGIGLKLAMRMANDAVYTSMMDLNNLVLKDIID
ncbi:MAG: ATP-binding protein [Firmicutes bacterium]|nr:ATP-binding protein [Bacillota bacterium]